VIITIDANIVSKILNLVLVSTDPEFAITAMYV
jgi:hypothetical protein